MSDDLGNILDAVVSTVSGLNLTLNGTGITVIKAKAPRQREGIDPDTLITVCKAQKKEERIRWGMGGKKWRVNWFVEVNLFTPNTGPNANLTDYGTWRTLLLNSFVKPPLGNTDVFDLDVTPEEFTPRDDSANQWDVFSFVISCSVIRSS